MAGTPRGIMRWAADGVSAEDSRGLDDPASGCTAWSVGQCMPFVDMPWAAKPADPAASRARIGVDTDGLPYILWPDGSWAYLLVSASGGALTDRRVPVWDGGTGRMVDSRIQDTGGSSVDVLVPLTVLNLLRVQTSSVAGAYTDLLAFKDTIAGNYARWSVDKGTFSAYGPVLKLWSQVAGATLDLGSIPAGGDNAYSLNGDRGATISSDDRDVRGGLVFGLPSYSDIATGLSLGSAAYADTTDFDAAGAAATAQSNAESYADNNFVPLVWSSVAAHQTSNQSLTHDAWNTIQLDSEDSDTLSEYNPSTYTFTPSVSGLYAIDFRVSVSGGTTTQIASIWVGTSSELKRIASGASTTFGGVTLVDLAAATGYTFRVFPSPGSPTTVSGASTTSLRIRRLA